jgi:quercetin 2,3-dioxygenase
MSQQRAIQQIFNGIPTSDGAGVKLTRIIGTQSINQLDPFLLLDAFGSDDPQEYIAGFPAHPHRGFETVTYMLAGKMRHEDSAGNSGVIGAGGVQWMTAGRGIIHSEMPEQEQGLLSGFQLWVNLPSENKLIEPKYQEKTKDEIAVESANGIKITVIAGKTSAGTQGVIDNRFIDPVYWDIHQQTDTVMKERVCLGHNAFIYVYTGSIQIEGSEQAISSGQLAVLSDGDSVVITAISDAKYLLIAGKPLNEPVARSGPFVMSSHQELKQAYIDYQSGNLA